MIKNRIYLLCMAAVMIFAATAVASAYADDYIYNPLAANQWGTFKEVYDEEKWESTGYGFKFNVNKTSIIDINYDGKNVENPYFDLGVDRDSPDDYGSDDKQYIKSDVIYPGTYYVRGATGSRFKYIIRPSVFKKNYSAKKAIKLKPNKKVEVVQTKYKDYARWYKIKLKKKKVIKFWTNKEDEYSDETNVSIYNSRFKEINTEGSGNNDDVYYSNKKIKKGTYYVRIGCNNSYTYFKWK